MAFKNPNVVANVSKEEFNILKEKVEQIESNLEEIKNNFTSNKNSNVETKRDKYTLLSKDKIKNAKLGGAPRIDYFNFTEFKQNEDNTMTENNNNESNDILDQVNDLTSRLANENVQTAQVNTPSNNIYRNDVSEDIIDISTIIGDEKKYRVKESEFQISTAKTSSGHRTYLVNDEQLQKLKSSYISDSKVIAA